MSDSVEGRASLLEFQRSAIAALRKDRFWIVAAAVLLAVGGAALGKLTTTTTSTAALVVTPLPLRVATDIKEDPLVPMLAEPLGIKTAVLICKSDAVLQATLNALRSGGKLSGEIKTLKQLATALDTTVTIEKETPYELKYSPVILLTAKAKTPADARLMVNTWAEECVKAARKLQEANQGPVMDAFAQQAEAAQKSLVTAEETYRAFKEKNSVDFLKERVVEMAKLRTTIDTAKNEAELLAAEAGAGATALKEQEQSQQPKLLLQWTPSDGILSALGTMQGGRATPQAKPEKPEALSIETANETYTRVATELALELAKAAGAKSKLEETEVVLNKFAQELDSLKAEVALAEIEDRRLARQVEIYETVYQNAAEKREYAQIAKNVGNLQLQLLSEGAEWAAPRFRKAILGGGLAGLCGLVLAACLSVGVRVVLGPFLRSEM